MKIKKKLSTKAMIIYSLGQLGWAILASLVTSQLSTVWIGIGASGETNYIPGAIAAGTFGIIFAISKVFDAFSDPFVGFISDKLKTKWGRRIPIMALGLTPLVIFSALIFWSPTSGATDGEKAGNAIFLFVMLILFYASFTMYFVPYTSLISDMSSTSEDRVKLSTAISVTYFIGSIISFGAPTIWSMLTPLFGIKWAINISVTILALISMPFLLIPTLMIKERDYIDFKTLGNESVQKMSLISVFQKVWSERPFRWFIIVDVLYWIGLTAFQSQVNFVVGALLGIDLKNAFIFVGIMGVVSFILYTPFSILINKLGVRKKIATVAFVLFSFIAIYGGLMMLNMDKANSTLAWIEGLIFVILMGIPIAILGIIENVIISDVISFHSKYRGEDIAASFYSIRSLTMKVGQALGLLFGSMFLVLGKSIDHDWGVRVILFFAGIVTLTASILMIGYNEIRYRGTKFLHKTVHLNRTLYKLSSKKIDAQIKEKELTIKNLKDSLSSKTPYSNYKIELKIKNLESQKELMNQELKELIEENREKVKSIEKIRDLELKNITDEKLIEKIKSKYNDRIEKLATSISIEKFNYNIDQKIIKAKTTKNQLIEKHNNNPEIQENNIQKQINKLEGELSILMKKREKNLSELSNIKKEYEVKINELLLEDSKIVIKMTHKYIDVFNEKINKIKKENNSYINFYDSKINNLEEIFKNITDTKTKNKIKNKLSEYEADIEYYKLRKNKKIQTYLTEVEIYKSIQSIYEKGGVANV